jgi:hypothetical protein
MAKVRANETEITNGITDHLKEMGKAVNGVVMA